MTITTDAGKTFNARSVYPMVRKGAAQLLIELEGAAMHEAAALEGAQVITARSDAPGIETRYFGYTRIGAMARTEAGTRVTLEREE